jgi:hypothetical protein
MEEGRLSGRFKPARPERQFPHAGRNGRLKTRLNATRMIVLIDAGQLSGWLRLATTTVLVTLIEREVRNDNKEF